MIKRIVVADYATYSHQPSEMNDLSQINFVYGSNGSGKTTISNFLHNQAGYPDSCSIEWNNNIPISVYTYNKAFRESYFGEDEIPGIFTLGKATKEQLEEVKRKKEELDKKQTIKINLSSTLGSKRRELQDENKDFSEWCWSDIKAKYEDSFKPIMRGGLSSKIAFSEKVLDETNKTYQGAVCTIDKLKERSNTLYGSDLNCLETIPPVDSTLIREIENDTIWQKKIVGSADVDLASLIAKLNIYDWVKQGRSYIAKSNGICPFCQKPTIDQSFVDKLERIFDAQYTADADLIEKKVSEYKEYSERVLQQIQSIIDRERQIQNSKVDISKFTNIHTLLSNSFSLINQKMEEKKRELSRSIEFESTMSIFSELDLLISSTNSLIDEHNRQVNNLANEQTSLAKDFWHFIQNDNQTSLSQHKKKIEDLNKAIKQLESQLHTNANQIDVLKAEIRKANKNITSVQSSVDEMNRMLRLYGFTNFSIVSAGNNRYRIQRDNGESVQDTLSEGEITFITFLYFMQLVMGAESAEAALSDRVVVIDDPISSLDSMVLYVVSSIVRSLISEIMKGSHVKQLILLTHNVFFHKEVSFVDGRASERSKYSFWIISKRDGVSSIQSHGHSNPIRSSYEMLWTEIKNWEKTSASSLQNTMRRIYETYFKVLGKMSDAQVLDSFEDADGRNICHSLIGWINDGSHTIPDDFYLVPTDDEREKYLKVFRMIFEKMGHMDHYNMMMGIKTLS